MDERKIRDMISCLFDHCANEDEVYELKSMLKDIVNQEYENRLYDISN